MPSTVATPSTDGQITIPNPWTGATHNTNAKYSQAAMLDQIPVFASQTAASTQAYSTEVIGVTSANIVGSNLVVIATSNKSANCSTLTLQTTGAGTSSFGTSCTKTIPYTYPTNGRTINVVNTSTTTPSIPVNYYPITQPGPVANNAVNDNYNVTATGFTDLAVLTNDGGTNISIQSVTQPSLGSVAINGAFIRYTAAGAGSTSFTYTITGDMSGNNTATVNITATANQPPAFGSASYAAANATEGQAYSSAVAQDATDPESDPITYSRNGGTCGAWATVATNGTISGTPSAGDVGSCTTIVRATATGGFDEATVNITVNAAPSCGTLSVLQNWSNVATAAAGAGTWNNTYTVAAGSNSSRLLVVSVGVHSSANNNPTFTATYGGRALTQISVVNSLGRASSWIGYLNEAGLDAASNSTLSVTATNSATGIDGYQIRAMVFDNVNQSAPIPASGAVNFVFNTYDAVAATTGNFSYDVDDYAVVVSGGYSGVTYTISGTGAGNYSAMSGSNYGVAISRTSGGSGPTTDNLTLTPSGSARELGTAVPIQSECNNN